MLSVTYPISAQTSLEDYVKCLYRQGSSTGGMKAHQSDATYLKAIDAVLGQAEAAMRARNYDLAYVKFMRLIQIDDEANLHKRIVDGESSKKLRSALNTALKSSDAIYQTFLPALLEQQNRDLKEAEGERQRIIALQMESGEEDTAEENDEERRHNERRQQLLTKGGGLSGGQIIVPPVVEKVIAPDIGEDFHRQRLARLNEANAARDLELNARLFASSRPITGLPPSLPPSSALPQPSSVAKVPITPKIVGMASTITPPSSGASTPLYSASPAVKPSSPQSQSPQSTTSPAAGRPASQVVVPPQAPPRTPQQQTPNPKLPTSSPQVPPQYAPTSSVSPASTQSSLYSPATQLSPPMTMMPPSLKNMSTQQPSQPVVSVSRTMLEPWRFSSGPPQSRRGLMNLGNTCYMNSTLQCLKQTELGNYVTSGVFAEFDDHNANSMIQAFAFVMRELEVKDLRSSVNPSQLKYQVGIKNDMFSGKSQQDASEFLRALLDGMHEEINAKRGQRATIGDIPNNIGEDHDIAAMYWKQYKQCNQSLIVNLFAFQERSSIICPNCGNNPRSFSPVLGIEVPIPTLNRAVCVEDCFAAYCKKEILDADSLYHCDSCKRKVSASKQLTFHTLPRTLVVTLKRFRSYGNFSDKVSSTVAFQECLEMRPFLSNNHWDGLTTYKLTGVINHQGNIHGGHYTADVKDMQDGLWRNFSDEVVRDASEPNFKLGYTLFYLLDERK